MVGLIPYNHHRAKVIPRKGHTFHCFIIGTVLVKKLGSLRLVENLNQYKACDANMGTLVLSLASTFQKKSYMIVAQIYKLCAVSGELSGEIEGSLGHGG